MKIALINKSDSTGGAAVVTYRLMQALRDAGADARMLVLEKLQDDQWVKSYASPLVDKYNFLSERWNIFTHNKFSRKNLFKVDTAKWGRNIASNKWIKEADVIMLNWINQGALSLRGIEKLCKTGKPMIWTMHDMWNCTGICHHAYECDGYKGVCRGCRYLSDDSIKFDLSTRVQAAKDKLYKLYPNLCFVAVSNWLADRCRESRLMHNVMLTTIPNAIDIDLFKYEKQENGNLGIPKGKITIVMGAARLDDTIKGFDILIGTTEYLRQNKPDLAGKLHLVLYGNIRDKSLLDRLQLPYTYLGTIKGIERLVNIYTQADIVLSTSLYETLPGTLIEGQACGCVPVSFGFGGQSDIIDHGISGYIADTLGKEYIAEGIEWATNTIIDRKFLHEEVARKFSSKVVAQKYLDLCQSLLSQ